MKQFVINTIMLLSLAMAALSCSMAPLDPGRYDGIYTVVVSGAVSDKESTLPLEGIKITLNASEPFQIRETIRTMTVYTDNRGRFTLTAEGFTEKIFCTLTAEDVNSEYESVKQELNISWNGSSFDEHTGTFYVNDCDFYLEKKDE
ncbi:MAG: hypothetical protein J5990_09395 [Bacteroidales bacterium]|nr:hypothetical protein [Bacteroidales bacterium]